MIPKLRSLIMAACIMILWMGVGGAATTISGYVGTGLGAAQSKFDTVHITFDAPDLSASETAWRLFSGCQIGANLGFELGYIELGAARVNEQAQMNYFETGATGVDIAALGILPIGKKLSGFVRAGFVFWSADLKYGANDTDSSAASQSGNDLTLGVGGQYYLGRTIGVRAEYTRYAIDKSKAGIGDFNVFAINILIAVGRK
jgi:hypothetical protein